MAEIKETVITSPFPIWEAIQAQPSQEDRAGEVEHQLTEILRQFGTISLTELILNRERGGQSFIALLDARNKNPQEFNGPHEVGQWTLRKLVNADGTSPKPGDEFFYQVGVKTTFIDGEGKRRPMNTQQQSIMQRRSRKRGDRNDPIKWDEYNLDKNCCIGPLGFFKAMAILTNFSDVGGLHAEKVGSEFGEPDRYYWLFEEVIPDKPKG